MEEIKCIISGRVQGVLFRDFARRKAQKLNLFGWVKNTSDGKVELIAQGERGNLEDYLELLKEGPLLARVSFVESEWGNPQEKFENFSIRY